MRWSKDGYHFDAQPAQNRIPLSLCHCQTDSKGRTKPQNASFLSQAGLFTSLNKTFPGLHGSFLFCCSLHFQKKQTSQLMRQPLRLFATTKMDHLQRSQRSLRAATDYIPQRSSHGRTLRQECAVHPQNQRIFSLARSAWHEFCQKR